MSELTSARQRYRTIPGCMAGGFALPALRGTGTGAPGGVIGTYPGAPGPHMGGKGIMGRGAAITGATRCGGGGKSGLGTQQGEAGTTGWHTLIAGWGHEAGPYPTA